MLEGEKRERGVGSKSSEGGGKNGRGEVRGEIIVLSL